MSSGDRNQNPGKRQRSRATVLWLSILVVISVVNTGYRYFCDNHALQLPLVEKILDPNLFPNDPFVATLTDYVSWVWWLVALLASVIDLKLVLLGFFWLTRLLLVYSCARVAAALFPESPVVAFCAAALAALAPQSLIGDGNLIEVFFEQTSLFVPLFMLALACLLERKAVRFFLLWALAFVVNPMYGSWAGLFFAGTYFIDPERPSLRAMLTATPIFLVLAAPNLVHGLRALSQPKPDLDLWAWTMRLLNAPHMAPSTWPTIQFLRFTCFVALVLVVGILVRGSYRRVWRLTAIWSSLSIGFLILGLAVGGGSRWLEILVLQPARATDLFYLSGGVAIVGVTAAMATQRMTSLSLLGFTGTFCATAFLLSPSFRDHAAWPTLLLGVLLATVLAIWRWRRPDAVPMGTDTALEATPSWKVLFRKTVMLEVVVIAALLIAMTGSLRERAGRWGSLEKALYRGPDEQVAAIAEWARVSTAGDAVFFHHPISWDWAQFRYLARRPVYGTWKDASAVLWSPPYTEEWSRRFAAFGFRGEWREHWDISRRGEIMRMRQSMSRRYKRLRDVDIAAMRSQFDIDYWIAPAKARSKHPVVFATERFKVLRVDGAARRREVGIPVSTDQ